MRDARQKSGRCERTHGITTNETVHVMGVPMIQRLSLYFIFILAIVVTGMDVRAQIVVDAGPDVAVCEGAVVLVGKGVSGGTGPYKYSWSPGSGMNDSNALKPFFSPRQAVTILVLKVTDSRNATGFDTVVVTMKARPKTDAGGAVTQCVGSTVLLGAARTASGGVPPYTYQWSGLPANVVGAATANPSYVANKAGINKHILRVTDALGCESFDTATITVRQSMKVVLPQRSFQTCAFEPRTIGGTGVVSGGNAQYSYKWFPSYGLSGTSIPNPTAFPDTTTKYKLMITDDQGCTIEDSVTINVRPRMRFAMTREYTVCPGKELRLADSNFVSGGVAPYQYKWTPPTGQIIVDTKVPNPSVVAYGTGRLLYTVLVTDAQGCSILDSVYVNMTGSPGAAFASVPKLCMNESYPYGVSGDSSYIYDWIVDGGTIVTGQGTQNIRVQWTRSGIGIIKLNVFDPATGCAKSGQNQTVVMPLPTPAVVNRGIGILCPGTTTTLEAEAGFVRYQWSNGLTTRRITVDKAGDYTCEVQDSNGCKGVSASLRVIVRQAPLPVISGPSTMCSYETIRLQASPGHTSYVWMSGETGPVITVTSPGTFKVIVVDTNGCMGESADFSVRTIPVKGTPGGDVNPPGREILFQYPDLQTEFVNEAEVDMVLDTISLVTTNKDLRISSVVIKGVTRTPDQLRGVAVPPKERIVMNLKYDPTVIDTSDYRLDIAVVKPCIDTVRVFGIVRSYDKTIRGSVSVENTMSRPNQIVYIPIQMQFDSERDSIEDATLEMTMTVNGRLVSVLDDTRNTIRKIEDIGGGMRRIHLRIEHLTIKYDRPFKLTSLRALTLASILQQDTMAVDRGSVQWTQGSVFLKKPIVRLRDGILTVSSFCFPHEVVLDARLTFTMSVSPTPAAEYVDVEIESGTEQTAAIEVYSLDGRVRLQETVSMRSGKSGRRLYVNGLENGHYILVVRSQEKSESRQFVVQR